jgi:6-phosphofructokinase 1
MNNRMQDFDFSVRCLGERKIPSPIALSRVSGDFLANYVSDEELIRYSVEAKAGPQTDLKSSQLLEKAGPREFLYFNPSRVHAGIVSCGGLCPGINDVIRSIVRCLWQRYGVRRITGIPFGFRGFLPEYAYQPIPLDPEVVDDIHKIGGTLLGSSRGGGERVTEIVDAIEQLNINMLFTIGGDGTQKGTLAVSKEIQKRGLKIAVVGIPKTIDNDIFLIQKTFGFETAVELAAHAVTAAHTEAHSSIYGIGLVKLMGRESGFIAAHTVLAVHEANYVLIPELEFQMEGPGGLLESLEGRLVERNHAVIVVAEGAGQDLLPSAKETDASGNKRLSDIGLYLKEKISDYFESKDIEVNIKYIDPSYMIRSSPANASDAVYCERLGANAVHAAMAGKTEVLIGLVNTEFVHIPTQIAVSQRKHVNPEEALWRDALEATQQPLSITSSSSLRKAQGNAGA